MNAAVKTPRVPPRRPRCRRRLMASKMARRPATSSTRCGCGFVQAPLLGCGNYLQEWLTTWAKRSEQRIVRGGETAMRKSTPSSRSDHVAGVRAHLVVGAADAVEVGRRWRVGGKPRRAGASITCRSPRKFLQACLFRAPAVMPGEHVGVEHVRQVRRARACRPSGASAPAPWRRRPSAPRAPTCGSRRTPPSARPRAARRCRAELSGDDRLAEYGDQAALQAAHPVAGQPWLSVHGGLRPQGSFDAAAILVWSLMERCERTPESVDRLVGDKCILFRSTPEGRCRAAARRSRLGQGARRKAHRAAWREGGRSC